MYLPPFFKGGGRSARLDQKRKGKLVGSNTPAEHCTKGPDGLSGRVARGIASDEEVPRRRWGRLRVVEKGSSVVEVFGGRQSAEANELG